MDLDNNPYLQPQPNPFDGQLTKRKEAEDIRIQMERLCFEWLIMTKDGQMLADLLRKWVIYPSHFSVEGKNAATEAIWWDGHRSGVRNLLDMANNHQKRIEQGGQR